MSVRRHQSKTGKLTFYVYVTGPDGKPVYIGKRGTKAEARALETEERARRLRFTPAQLDAAAMTLDQAWEKVLPVLSERSKQIYANTWKTYVRPYLGDRKIAAITPLDVDGMREKLLAKHSPGTTGLALTILCVSF
jgi:hypothetical protein